MSDIRREGLPGDLPSISLENHCIVTTVATIHTVEHVSQTTTTTTTTTTTGVTVHKCCFAVAFSVTPAGDVRCSRRNSWWKCLLPCLRPSCCSLPSRTLTLHFPVLVVFWIMEAFKVISQRRVQQRCNLSSRTLTFQFPVVGFTKKVFKVFSQGRVQRRFSEVEDLVEVLKAVSRRQSSTASSRGGEGPVEVLKVLSQDGVQQHFVVLTLLSSRTRDTAS